MQRSIKSSLQFAGSYTATRRAYQVVVNYKDQVYYSDRLPKMEAQSLQDDVSVYTVDRLIDRGVLVAG
jgi:hypothetical protein